MLNGSAAVLALEPLRQHHLDNVARRDVLLRRLHHSLEFRLRPVAPDVGSGSAAPRVASTSGAGRRSLRMTASIRLQSLRILCVGLGLGARA